ncbi:MAG: sigma-70 family RNA polymerase sigma factor [Gemmatimonadaceae bacterium]
MAEVRVEIRGLAQNPAAPVRIYAERGGGGATARSFDDAFAELFDAQFQRIYRIVHRMSGDPDLASDLAQDAFVRLYRRRSMPDVPTAWLITVALNLYRNSRATQKRRKRLLTLERGARAHSDPAPAPDRALIADATATRVRTALDEMSEREQQMLLMRAEGYSYREIAVALELHEGSVGTLLARAVRSFREHYYDDADTP